MTLYRRSGRCSSQVMLGLRVQPSQAKVTHSITHLVRRSIARHTEHAIYQHLIEPAIEVLMLVFFHIYLKMPMSGRVSAVHTGIITKQS